MAKAESSPKPFKDFKEITNAQDFYAFFGSKFQLLESQVENHQPYELFKVANKETLTVFTTNESDPYKLEVGTYNIILYETKHSKLKVRVFGALASFQNLEKIHFDRILSSGNFSNEMNQPEYIDADVNHHLSYDTRLRATRFGSLTYFTPFNMKPSVNGTKIFIFSDATLR